MGEMGDDYNIPVVLANADVPFLMVKRPKNPVVRIISLEGNIGAGKTSIADYILQTYHENDNVVLINGQRVNIIVSKEPLNEFEKDVTDFYENPQFGRGYLLQSKILVIRSRRTFHMLQEAELMCKRTGLDTFVVIDRSLYGDEFFARTCFELGHMDESEYSTYNTIWQLMDEIINKKLSAVIYVNTNVEKCLERIKLRGREMEKGIKTDYLDSLKSKHDAWLCDGQKSLGETKLFIYTNPDMDAVTQKEAAWNQFVDVATQCLQK